jgi:hypothetical protein
LTVHLKRMPWACLSAPSDQICLNGPSEAGKIKKIHRRNLMKKIIKKAALFALPLAGAAAALFPEMAMAANVGEIAGNMTGQFGNIANMVGGASYLLGAGFGVKGALKLKEHNENPQQTKLSAPLTMLAVSGALFALPSVMDTGAESTFGASAKKLNVSGGGLGG